MHREAARRVWKHTRERGSGDARCASSDRFDDAPIPAAGLTTCRFAFVSMRTLRFGGTEPKVQYLQALAFGEFL